MKGAVLLQSNLSTQQLANSVQNTPCTLLWAVGLPPHARCHTPGHSSTDSPQPKSGCSLLSRWDPSLPSWSLLWARVAVTQLCPVSTGSYSPGPAEWGRVQPGLGAEGAHTGHSWFLEAFSPFLLCPHRQAVVPRQHLPHRSWGPQESIQDGKTLSLRCHQKACLGPSLVVQRLNEHSALPLEGVQAQPLKGELRSGRPLPLLPFLGFSICTWILRTSAPTVSQHSEEQGV